jgi:hypothetical protein
MATTQQPASGLVPLNPDEHHRQRTQTCLGCGRPFASAHIGYRICRRCRGLDAWKFGTGDFTSYDGFPGRPTPCRTA